jgi:hypothetical protein
MGSEKRVIFGFGEFILEKRDMQSRERVTVGRRICDFLEKSGFKYQQGDDSRVFVGFKTGDYESFIPPKELGGKLYQSPQGFYCYDMNGFKRRLFGDSPVAPDNFHPFFLDKSDDIISSFGFGYGNHNNKVDQAGISGYGNIPRYMNIVRVKDDAVILTSRTGWLKARGPVMKLLRFYSHYLLKESNADKFDPKDRRDIGNMSIIEMEKHFKVKSSSMKEEASEWVLWLVKELRSDSRGLHISVYSFIMWMSKLISEKKKFVRFSLICRAVGIDGFTQRSDEGGFIHSDPPFQTVLLTRRCVQDKIVIDLRKDINVDEYVSKMKNPELAKKTREKDKIENRRWSTYQMPLKLISEDQRERALSFMKQLKKGDFVKIGSLDEDTTRGVEYEAYLCEVVEPLGQGDKMETRGVRYLERYEYLADHHFTNPFGLDEEWLLTMSFDRPRAQEMPMISPVTLNGAEFAYWVYRSKELKAKGFDFESYNAKLESRDRVDEPIRDFDQLISSKGHLDCFDLTPERLVSFAKGHLSAMRRNFSFEKGSMYLSVYRGDLSKPIKTMYSGLANDLIN